MESPLKKRGILTYFSSTDATTISWVCHEDSFHSITTIADLIISYSSWDTAVVWHFVSNCIHLHLFKNRSNYQLKFHIMAVDTTPGMSLNPSNGNSSRWDAHTQPPLCLDHFREARSLDIEEN